MTTTANSPPIAIILAGGKSTRMGEDKAQLHFQNMPLYQWMATVLTPLFGQHIFISGGAAPTAVPDEQSHLGPLGGITSILKNFTQLPSHVLVVPVDMPLLITSDYEQLEIAIKHHDCASYKTSRFPIIFRPSEKLLLYLAQCMSAAAPKKSRSIKALLDFYAASHTEIEPGDPARFINANTPEEWQQCLTNNVIGTENHE